MSKMNLSNRLLVAKELLTLALELADGTAHQNYSFYLTDLTADNIAVQLNKTSGLLQSLKVIDLSDVIIVVNNHSIKKTDNGKSILGTFNYYSMIILNVFIFVFCIVIRKYTCK